MKIAVLSSHTKSLLWFRMDMMQAFIDNDHTVVAFGDAPESDWQARFREYSIDYRQLYVERNGINPFKDIKTFVELCRFMKREKPDKVFAYQAKTVIYGSIAAKLNGITEVYPLIAGLGSILRGIGIKSKIVKAIMKMGYKTACSCSQKVFFQNNDDKNEFVYNGLINADKAVIINGSGVNIEKFQPVSLPLKPAFLFIGRLIKDKGIIEYLEACKMVKAQYPNIRCSLVGSYDSNPSALKPEELKPYIDDGIVEYFGEQSDVRPFIAQCSTYVLPSYHEGTPKTVLEAMAMGRAIITTDVPGCKETISEMNGGFLVAAKSIQEIQAKMVQLIESPELIETMGLQARVIAEEKYDVKLINSTIINTMEL